MRILYVEDNELVREVTQELLAQEGRTVVALSSAEEALEAFRAAPFDLLITDVSLPVMSGMDLARTLQRERPGLPIIVASGYSIDLAAESWADNVRTIIKPFDGDEIDALIAAITQR